jgi:hypothetical protein
MKKVIVVAMVLAAMAVAAESQMFAKLYKTAALGPRSVVVACLSGHRPTVNAQDSLVIVSCDNVVTQ